MANHFEIFTSFLFFFSFLPHLSSACRLNCASNGPPVRFPFWIKENDQDTSYCGFEGFSLSCDQNTKQTLMVIPYWQFVVTNINYNDQVVTLTDTATATATKCLVKDFLIIGRMSPSPQPFSYLHEFRNYSFFTCSPQAEMVGLYPTVSCLSNVDYTVVVVETSRVPSKLDPNCYVYDYPTAMVPIGPSSSEWDDINYGVKLKWDNPDCKACSAVGQACGILSTSVLNGPQVGCIAGSNFAMMATVIGLVLSAILWMVGLALRLTKISSSGRSSQNPENTEMSMLTIDGQLPVGVGASGLDQKTIDSYPKKQLGESREFSSSSENACPICLGEYEAMETIRTIPECNHYFHANCIDNWLRRNPTCPVCRTLPEGKRLE